MTDDDEPISQSRPVETTRALTLSAVEQFADRLATREHWLEDQARVRRTMSERFSAGFLSLAAL